MKPSDASFASREAWPTVPVGSRITTSAATISSTVSGEPGEGLDGVALDEPAPDPPQPRDRDRRQEPGRPEHVAVERVERAPHRAHRLVQQVERERPLEQQQDALERVGEAEPDQRADRLDRREQVVLDLGDPGVDLDVEPVVRDRIRVGDRPRDPAARPGANPPALAEGRAGPERAEGVGVPVRELGRQGHRRSRRRTRLTSLAAPRSGVPTLAAPIGAAPVSAGSSTALGRRAGIARARRGKTRPVEHGRCSAAIGLSAQRGGGAARQGEAGAAERPTRPPRAHRSPSAFRRRRPPRAGVVSSALSSRSSARSIWTAPTRPS